jgi:hypothetical protein
MKRLALAACTALFAACVVVPARRTTYVEPAPPPPPRAEASPSVWYYGPHFIPEDQGGGWCYEEGAHVHGYFPDRPDVYYVDRGYYTYAGPSEFVYDDGHPLPGGGWCFIRGPHVHEYYPPPRVGFSWRAGRGFFYEGEYRAQRPPPPAFWPQPHVWRRTPPPPRLRAVEPPPRPTPRPLPPRPEPLPPPRPGARTDPVPPPDRHELRDRDRDIRRERDDVRPAPGKPASPPPAVTPPPTQPARQPPAVTPSPSKLPPAKPGGALTDKPGRGRDAGATPRGQGADAPGRDRRDPDREREGKERPQ